jgi:hypothetical protein
MGKYFKEEETSNRIKRFKTSDIQEKNSRFAQMSRVITVLDKFQDLTRVLFKTWIRTSKLIKVKPEILSKLQSEFETIVIAQRGLAIQKSKKISELEKLIEVAEARKVVLKTELHGMPAGDVRNNKIDEIARINNYLGVKNKELKPLKEEYSEIEKAAKAEIDAKIQEFNQNNGLVTQLSWNGDLVSPKMDFLLPTGLSRWGLGVAISRVGTGKTKVTDPGSVFNSFRNNAAAKLEAYQVKILEEQLNSIGFYKNTFSFLIQDGDKWKTVDLTLHKFLENLASGTFKSGKIAIKDDEEREKLQTAFNDFLQKLDQAESGWKLHPFFRTAVATILAISTVAGLHILGVRIPVLPLIATLPQTIERHRQLNDPNKMKNDMASARKNLSIGEQEKQQIEALERLLLTPNLAPRARRSLERSIKNLKGGN